MPLDFQPTTDPEGRNAYSPIGEPLMTDVWYVADQSRRLKRGRPRETDICGGLLMLQREKSGAVTGRFDGAPAEVAERDGLVWFYYPGNQCRVNAPPAPPPLKCPKGGVRYCHTVTIPASQDDAAYGLLDPAHTPFVHKSPLWRGNGVHKLKTKPFEPNDFGWTMMPHAPVNSDIYKLIGGQIRVRIEFRLPGLRAEFIENKVHTVLGLTALTPIDARNTRLRQIFFWNSPILNLLQPVAPLVAGPFLDQDVDIMELRRKNEAFNPGKGTLVGDSDRQFLWYLAVKKAWQKARAEGTAFKNPHKAQTLQWKT
ncbi:MAG: hypothetical protein AAGH87_03450 [Pseudomonadota bacterium]